jgi:hypothetical protein
MIVGKGAIPIRAGSAMRFFKPCAPKAPSMTLEAPYRQPIVQNGGILMKFLDWRIGIFRVRRR